MKRLLTLVALLTIFTFILTYSYAVDPTTLEWKIPAKYRLIYLVDLNGVADTNVYIDLNIPSYVYDHLVQRLQAGQLCGVVENNRLPDELWPVVFYASDLDTSQRYVPNYSIASYYTYTTACTDVNGAPYVAKLPETIRIHIPALDGNIDTFNTFNHYILLYEPFLFLDTMDLTYATQYWYAFGWIGAPMIGNEFGDLPTLYNSSTIFTLNIPLSDTSEVLVKMSDKWGLVSYPTLTISFLFTTSDGRKIELKLPLGAACNTFTDANASYVFNGYSSTASPNDRTHGFIDVLWMLQSISKIPISSISELTAVGYCSSGGAMLDDVYIIAT